MIVKVYTWIPRSFIHVTEVYNKALSDGYKPVINNGVVSFSIKDNDYGSLLFSLDSDGLYSLSVNLPETSVEDRVKAFFSDGSVILLKLIKRYHSVTAVQINEGVLVSNFSVIAFTKKVHKFSGLSLVKTNGLSLLVPDDYYSDSPLIVAGDYSKVISLMDYLAFTNLLGRFFYSMMNKMEAYHNGTQEVINLLETNPESDLITNAYLNFDLVKKDASDSWSKVEQAIDCLYRKKNSFESLNLTSSLRLFVKRLGFNERFNKLVADKDYAVSLWNLLINHLEYVDTAVEARINYHNMVNNNLSKWFSVINAVFIVLFIILVTGFNSFIAGGLFSAWLISYLVTFLIVKRRNL